MGEWVAIAGGSGFIGRHVAENLLRGGARVRIISRHPERQWSARVLGDLGCVEFARADVSDVSSLERAFVGASAVVNLVGAFGGNLDAVQGRGVGGIATAARRAGAGAFVHVSAIGADAGSRVAYARTKAEGEQAALDAFPEATILRPSVVFAGDDNFLNMFARMMRLVAGLPMPNILPVFVPEGLLQPVFAGDVALAVAAALGDPARHGGRTYALGGPEVMTMLDLNRRIAGAAGTHTRFLPMPDVLAAMFAALPATPISRDQIALLKAGNTVAQGARTLADLGVQARPMGLFLKRWLA